MFTGIGSITKLSDAQSRSITAENVYGEKGRGGMADLTEKAQPEVAKIGQKWDGDREFPTICGTGTEDYFGGAWCFGQNYSAPFLGYPLGSCDNKPGNRHALYRFHLPDPVRFQKDLKVIMQAIGWRSEGRYLPLQDDIASVAYWYQAEPHAKFAAFPDKDALEVI